MYERLNDPNLNDRFVDGMRYFVKIEIQHDEGHFFGCLRCPCTKYKTRKFKTVHDLEYHLVNRGFTKDYNVWIYHNEPWGQNPCLELDGPSNVFQLQNNCEDMLVNALLPEYYEETEAVNKDEYDEDTPSESRHYFAMLNISQSPLYDDCKLSLLVVASRLLTLTCEYTLLHRAVDEICKLLKNVCPPENIMKEGMYDIKELMKGLRLPMNKIDCCPNDCMLFWKESVRLERCSICNADRYKEKRWQKKRLGVSVLWYFPITPRLQWLFTNSSTNEAMSWKAALHISDDIMVHPFDSWRHLGCIFPSFVVKARNVH